MARLAQLPETHELEPVGQPLPGVPIPVQRARALAVPFEIFWNPGMPAVTVEDRGAIALSGFQFGAQGIGPGGVVGVVKAQADGTVPLPLPGSKCASRASHYPALKRKIEHLEHFKALWSTISETRIQFPLPRRKATPRVTHRCAGLCGINIARLAG